MSKGMNVRVEWNGPKVEALVHANAAKALWGASAYILGESQKQVPLDTGTLLHSGVVDVDEGALAATVSYDTPYAVRWHEHDARFQRGRKKKYLEDVVNDMAVRAEVIRYFEDMIP